MTRAEFVSEFSGIVYILKEHAYLQFSPTGMREYAEKENSAMELFARLVTRHTGIGLVWPRGIDATINPGTLPTYEAASNAVRRTAANLKATAARLPPNERHKLETLAEAWARARERL